jgi:excisionase family DNA binding protein
VPQETSSTPEKFLKAKDVAEFLDVHVSTVYRLADSGRLRAHRLGEGRLKKRGLRIPESAVSELLQQTRTA